ncbi:hypothetical protein LCGC14_1332380 [marine sediment metagenome]|uniref:Uncharacterized protein n=1 Tax=marine sediment metagenome TaxID=412755 RepID=A0A0F9KG23_9ZZZZ
MADDSELDYLRAWFSIASFEATAKHFSEIKKIDSINSTKRILIHPGELMNVDGKFYTKRYKVQISDSSEAELMSTMNNIIRGLELFNRGEPFNGIYDAPHNFLIYANGSNALSTDFITRDENGAGCTTTIVQSYLTHGKVLKFSDSNGATRCIIYNDFDTTHITGTVEFHMASPNTNLDSYVYFDNSDVGSLFMIRFSVDKLQHYISPSWVNIMDVTDATWYHIKITFDCSLGTNGRYWLWVNEIAKVSDQEMYQTALYIERLVLTTLEGDNPAIWYMDAIAHDWDDYYQIGDNLIGYSIPDILVHMNLVKGDLAEEQGRTKRWAQDLWFDIEWCIE